MAKKSTGTSLALWDEEMARDAKMAAGTEASAMGGGFYSIRGSVLSFGSNPLPDNQMAVIIADSLLLNEYYDTPFEEQSSEVRTPACFAIATERGPNAEASMQPHDEAADPQSEMCKGCDMNRFGSAERGRGKACGNKRRLAIIPAGDLGRGGGKGDLELYEDDFIRDSAFGWLNVPPTSTIAYASYVSMLDSTFHRAPYAFVTKIKCYPHPKHKMAALSFEPLVDLRKEFPDLIPIVVERHRQAMKDINFTYPQPEEEGRKPAARRKRAGRAAGTEPAPARTPARKPRARPEPEPAQAPTRRARRAAEPEVDHPAPVRRARPAPAAPAAAPAGNRPKFARPR